jgi:hypothetical protein
MTLKIINSKNILQGGSPDKKVHLEWNFDPTNAFPRKGFPD